MQLAVVQCPPHLQMFSTPLPEPRHTPLHLPVLRSLLKTGVVGGGSAQPQWRPVRTLNRPTRIRQRDLFSYRNQNQVYSSFENKKLTICSEPILRPPSRKRSERKRPMPELVRLSDVEPVEKEGFMSQLLDLRSTKEASTKIQYKPIQKSPHPTPSILTPTITVNTPKADKNDNSSSVRLSSDLFFPSPGPTMTSSFSFGPTVIF